MDAHKFSKGEFAIGMDLGGHHLRGAVVDGSGSILKQKQMATDAGRDLQAVLQQINALSQELQASFASPTVLGLCLGVPGFMNHDTGFLTSSPNFPAWKNVSLHDELRKHVALPCLTENDANLAGLGEYWLGAGKGAQVLICLTLGTGVGGAVLQGGHLLKGSRGLAGELGHMMVDPQGPECGCGARGCLETLASGTGLQRMSGVSAKEVFQRAQAGDEKAIATYQQFGKTLGQATASLAQIFDPTLFVIGGQVSLAWDLFSPSLQNEFRQRMSRHPARETPHVQAQCGNDAGILGAAYRVFETYGQSAIK